MAEIQVIGSTGEIVPLSTYQQQLREQGLSGEVVLVDNEKGGLTYVPIEAQQHPPDHHYIIMDERQQHLFDEASEPNE